MYNLLEFVPLAGVLLTPQLYQHYPSYKSCYTITKSNVYVLVQVEAAQAKVRFMPALQVASALQFKYADFKVHPKAHAPYAVA